MTKLRLQNEFHDKDFRYELSPYDGCMAALGEAVNKLKEDPAFKLPGEDQVFMVGPDEVAAERRLSKEAQLLSNFVEACSAIFREHVWVKNRDEIDAEAFTAEYKGQVELFVSKLKKQENKNIRMKRQKHKNHSKISKQQQTKTKTLHKKKTTKTQPTKKKTKKI